MGEKVKVFIYILKDPITKKVRYVGQTININVRYSHHLKPKKTEKPSYKSWWIKSLLRKGHKPVMEIVEIAGIHNWQAREKHWIKKFKEQGARLTNGTDGGEGVLGFKFSIQQRNEMSVRRKGIPKSDSIKEHLSKVLMGHFVSKAHRRKTSRSLIGHSVSEKTRMKLRLAHKGRVSLHRKNVLQLNTHGQIIWRWESLSSAAKELNLSIHNISSCCHNKRNFCGGFQWKLA
jgi:group I intron endonuclease